MTERRIGIILASIRPGRNGKAVADWVLEQAQDRDGVKYELIDLLDYPLPATPGHEPTKQSKAWADKISELDGYVFYPRVQPLDSRRTQECHRPAATRVAQQGRRTSRIRWCWGCTSNRTPP